MDSDCRRPEIGAADNATDDATVLPHEMGHVVWGHTICEWCGDTPFVRAAMTISKLLAV